MSEPPAPYLNEVDQIEEQISTLRKRLLQLKQDGLGPVQNNYRFSSPKGEHGLLDLFGDRDDLLLIHNMGTSCVYCTTYGDGINGVLHHLENRSAVALLSPDPVDEQQAFAAGRGWNFRMLSSQPHGDAFNRDMGFYHEDEGGVWPGVSGFRREGEVITRTGYHYFNPDDEFCVAWPLMTLLQDGHSDWTPQFTYNDERAG